MSTKTLRKRIALVAVAALGAGVLSVAPASANVAAGNVTVVAKTSLINAGSCAISSTAGAIGGTFIDGSDVRLNNAASTGTSYLALSGPAVFVSAAAAGGSATGTVTPTTITQATNAANDVYVLRLTGLGTVTITVSPTSATAAVDVITINSVAACAGGTFSAARSNTTIVDVLEADSDATEATAWVTRFNGQDTADEEIIAVGGQGYIRSQINDVYGADLASRAMIATSTDGCFVGLADITTSAPSIARTAATAVLASTGADVIVAVSARTAGVPANCTVTLSHNGVTVATKSFKQLGAVASITVSSITVGAKGGDGYYRAAVRDALGNPLPGVTIENDPTEANNAAAATIVSDSASNAAQTGTTTDASTGAIRGTTPALTSGNLATAAGEYRCTAKGGAAKVTVRALVSGVTYVTSAPFDVYCGATSVDTWTISMDKATYAPGEIATLTVSAKDADGHLAGSALTLGASEYSFGGLTAITAPTTADLFNSAAGAKTYRFSVGTTEGSFVGTFKITGTTDTAAKTVQYKIANAVGTTSNADVLKAIVSLIASINKQIAALQRALLRR
jgi:trimeric autotransporter adhesin